MESEKELSGRSQRRALFTRWNEMLNIYISSPGGNEAKQGLENSAESGKRNRNGVSQH